MKEYEFVQKSLSPPWSLIESSPSKLKLLFYKKILKVKKEKERKGIKNAF